MACQGLTYSNSRSPPRAWASTTLWHCLSSWRSPRCGRDWLCEVTPDRPLSRTTPGSGRPDTAHRRRRHNHWCCIADKRRYQTGVRFGRPQDDLATGSRYAPALLAWVSDSRAHAACGPIHRRHAPCEQMNTGALFRVMDAEGARETFFVHTVRLTPEETVYVELKLVLSDHLKTQLQQ